MTTHRSLNKLEFKAHMSIHNKVEVPEGETHDTNYTRDRFGRNHLMNDADGNPRIRRQKTASIWILTLSFAALFCAQAEARNTDMKVESETFDDLLMAHKLNPPEETGITFIRSGDTTIGLNDDVEPNMSVRF